MKTSPEITSFYDQNIKTRNMFLDNDAELVIFWKGDFQNIFENAKGFVPAALSIKINNIELEVLKKDIDNILGDNSHKLIYNAEKESLTLLANDMHNAMLQMTDVYVIKNTSLNDYWPSLQSILCFGIRDLDKLNKKPMPLLFKDLV